MFKILLYSLFFVAISAYTKYVHTNIVAGGSMTTIDKYPSLASLLFSWGTTGHRQSCGGVIITRNSILTAAHCTYGHPPERWMTRLGSNLANKHGVVFRTAVIIIHHDYNSYTLYNDISIIRVSGTINFSDVIRPGSFAGSLYHVPDNQEVWVTGWGRFGGSNPTAERLRHAQVFTVNLDVCRQRFSYIGLDVTDDMLCAGVLGVNGRDQCLGDFGSPLFHNGVVVGIFSWGAPNTCKDPRWPGVYVRLQRYPAWINANLS